MTSSVKCPMVFLAQAFANFCRKGSFADNAPRFLLSEVHAVVEGSGVERRMGNNVSGGVTNIKATPSAIARLFFQ